MICPYCGGEIPSKDLTVRTPDGRYWHFTCADSRLDEWVKMGEENERLKMALELMINDMGEDSCPYEYDYVDKPECAECPHDHETHVNTERDVQCWKEYYYAKAGEDRGFMKFITLNPPSNEKEKEIWDFIKLAESKINDQEPRSYQASYVRGMMAIFNLFTHDHFMDVPKEKIKEKRLKIMFDDELIKLREKMQKINDIAVNYQEDGPFIDTVTFAIISEIYDLSLGKE